MQPIACQRESHLMPMCRLNCDKVTAYVRALRDQSYFFPDKAIANLYQRGSLVPSRSLADPSIEKVVSVLLHDKKTNLLLLVVQDQLLPAHHYLVWTPFDNWDRVVVDKPLYRVTKLSVRIHSRGRFHVRTQLVGWPRPALLCVWCLYRSIEMLQQSLKACDISACNELDGT